MTKVDIYGGKNPFQMPLYTYADASRYLAIPRTTVAYWARGGSTTGKEGRQTFYPPVLSVPGRAGLSFFDLVELHVLKALRKVHGVSLDNVRAALRTAEEQLSIDHLLLHDELRTYGGDVFIEHLGNIVALSRGGQVALKDILSEYLQRVERDSSLIPIKLYPNFEGAKDERPVVINPRVSFGKPTVADTAISTGTIVDRIDAGESVEDVAKDYEIEPSLVISAVKYEKAA